MNKNSQSNKSSLPIGFTSWFISDNNINNRNHLNLSNNLSNTSSETFFNTIPIKSIENLKRNTFACEIRQDIGFGDDMTSGHDTKNTFYRRNALKKNERKRLSKSRSINRKELYQLKELPPRPTSVKYNNINANKIDSVNKRLITDLDPKHKFIEPIVNNSLTRHNSILKNTKKPQPNQRNTLTSRLNISVTSKKNITCFDPKTSENELPKLQASVQLTNIKVSRVKERVLFLYRDLLVIAKFKSEGKYKLKERVRLSQAWVDVCEDEATIQNKNDTHKNLHSSLLMGWPGNKNNLVTIFANQPFRDHWYNELVSTLKRLQEKENFTRIPVKVKHQSRSLIAMKTMLLDNKETSQEFLQRSLKEFRINKDSSHYQLLAMNHTGAVSRYLDGIEIPFYLLISPLSKSSVNSWSSSETYILLKEKFPLKDHLTSSSLQDIKFKPLFGRPLDELVTNEDTLEPFLLTIFEHIYIYGSVTKGIFRKAASPGVKITKERLEKGDLDVLKNESTVNQVSLLKSLLKQLPDCLLTSRHYHEWMNASTISNENVWKTQIKKLLLKLPQRNLAILFLLLSILKHLSIYSSHNLMCIANLSTCISQCLLWLPAYSTSTTLNTPQQLDDAKQLNQLIQMMIKLVDDLFVYKKNSENIVVSDVSVAKEQPSSYLNSKPFGYLDEKLKKVINDEEEEKAKIVMESSVSLTFTHENLTQNHSKTLLSKSTCDISTLQNQQIGLFSFSSDELDNAKPTKTTCSSTGHYKSDMSFINCSRTSTELFRSSSSSIFGSSSSSNYSSPVVNSSLEIYFNVPATNIEHGTILQDNESYNTRF